MSDAIPRQAHPQRSIYGWFQDRLNVETLWRALFIRKIPFGVNLLYTLGFASLALFLVVAAIVAATQAHLPVLRRIFTD